MYACFGRFVRMEGVQGYYRAGEKDRKIRGCNERACFDGVICKQGRWKRGVALICKLLG